MREAVIICSLLNLYMGGQNCPRRTLLPGQIWPGGQILGGTKLPVTPERLQIEMQPGSAAVPGSKRNISERWQGL